MSDEHTHQAIEQIQHALETAGLLEFAGEVQLLEWSKSTSRDGPKVKLLLPDDEAISPFEQATVRKGGQAGQLYYLFAVRMDEVMPARAVSGVEGVGAHTKAAVDDERRAPGKPANRLAQHLHQIRYWHNPKLWAAMEAAAIYTQSEHKVWIERQPCAALMNNLVPHVCGGEVCAHHTNSAAIPAAGHATDNPRKPPHWYTIPACHVFHTWCHSSTGAIREDKQKLLELAVALTAGQMKAQMKVFMGIGSMSEVMLSQLHKFEGELGLPLTTREAYD